MGRRRRESLKSMQSFAERIEEHFQKLSSNPSSTAANHWRMEIRAFIEECKRRLPSLGRRTGDDWLPRIAEWERRLEAMDDEPGRI